MRLVLCDGNRILGEALAAALEACDRDMTAVATSTADACLMAVTHFRPDICVLDPQFPAAEDGLRFIREIRNHCPGLAVLVVSEVSNPAVCAQARKLGIAGFLGKNRSVSQIADALRMIAAGEPVFDPVLVPPHEAPRPQQPLVLTPRGGRGATRDRLGTSTHPPDATRDEYRHQYPAPT